VTARRDAGRSGRELSLDRSYGRPSGRQSASGVDRGGARVSAVPRVTSEGGGERERRRERSSSFLARTASEVRETVAPPRRRVSSPLGGVVTPVTRASLFPVIAGIGASTRTPGVRARSARECARVHGRRHASPESPPSARAHVIARHPARRRVATTKSERKERERGDMELDVMKLLPPRRTAFRGTEETRASGASRSREGTARRECRL